MPSHLRCELSRSNPCTPLEVDFVLPPLGPEQRLSLKVRSRVTQRCPRRVFLAERRVRCIPPVCGGLVLFVAEGYPVVRKSSSTEQTRDKVRRRFTLSVTAESWWDDRAVGHRLWLWGWT